MICFNMACKCHIVCRLDDMPPREQQFLCVYDIGKGRKKSEKRLGKNKFITEICLSN